MGPLEKGACGCAKGSAGMVGVCGVFEQKAYVRRMGQAHFTGGRVLWGCGMLMGSVLASLDCVEDRRWWQDLPLREGTK